MRWLRWLHKGFAVSRYSKSRAARAEHDSFYQPSLMAALLALALAFLLWHGMARAENFAPPQDDTSQPAAEAAPLDSGCTDTMDFSPEENLQSPFDADTAAFRQLQTPLLGLQPAALDDSCQGPALLPQQV
jgi:hypothetical protein